MFVDLDEDGRCPGCAKKYQKKMEQKKLIEEKRKAEEEQRIKEQTDPSLLLEKVPNSHLIRPPMRDGVPMVYRYSVPIHSVDRETVYNMTQEKVFSTELRKMEDDEIHLLYRDKSVAILGDKISIVSDWLKNKDPYYCQFSSFKKDKESVLLLLYRDDETRIKNNCNLTIAKLTGCMSIRTQDNIDWLEKGPKLFVEEDDNGKWYVRDINYREIGKLPAKFSKMQDDGSLRGMFFDHCERTENANGDPIDIPYVRFYFD